MRVTQTINQTQFLSNINSLETAINQTQNQVSSGVAFSTASQDPIAAGRVNNFSQALAQSQQYGTNAGSAQTNLNVEDSALSQVQSQLQSLRDLALEANSGALTNTDRAAIAQQAVQIQNSLLNLANTQNGSGEYIFSGFATQTQPFTLSSAGAAYNGDVGQFLIDYDVIRTAAAPDDALLDFMQTTYEAAANRAGWDRAALERK